MSGKLNQKENQLNFLLGECMQKKLPSGIFQVQMKGRKSDIVSHLNYQTLFWICLKNRFVYICAK